MRTWEHLSTEDRIRESIILGVLFSLYYFAYRAKSPLSVFFITIAFIQHLVPLTVGVEFLPDPVIFVGSHLFALTGFWILSPVISFAGTYSAVSKYKAAGTLVPLFGSLREANKGVAALFLWSVLFALVWLYHSDKRRRKCDEIRPQPIETMEKV